MDDEEDDVILLEGGELHRYLLCIVQEDCPVYYNQFRRDPAYKDLNSNSTMMAVNSESKLQLDMILNSSLLLEEDAHFLYKLSEDTDINYERLNFKTLLSFGGFVLTGCVSLAFKKHRHILLPLWLGSTFCFVTYARRLMSHRSINTQLTNLCNNMSSAFVTKKKYYYMLSQNMKNIATKQIYTERILAKELVSERYNWTRKELSEMSLNFTSELLDVISWIKSKTRNLLDVIGQDPNDNNYLATKTDSDLGVDKIKTEYISGEIDLKSLEVLRHLDILLESEFLRILGFALCKINDIDKRHYVSDIIKSFNDCLEKMWKKQCSYMKDYYKRVVEGPATITNATTNGAGCNKDVKDAVKNLRTCVHSLAVEITDIEETLSRNYQESPEEIHNIVCASLESINCDIEEVNYTIQKIKKLIRKKRAKSALTLSVKEEAMVKEVNEEKVTTIEVGRSDFSIRSPDQVFIGIPDESDHDDTNENPDYEDELKPDKRVRACYDRVMSEIKVAIESKKVEFAERELSALKQNPDYEAYLNFQDKEETAKNNGKINDNNSGEADELSQDKMDFHKALGLMAVQKSVNWKSQTYEETNFEN